MLINNILNSFYECTLIVSRTINTSIYLKFRVFNAIFNYLKHLKKIIKVNNYSLIEIIIKICNKVLTNLAKYYLRTKELDNTLYNLINNLNFTQKVNFYKS